MLCKGRVFETFRSLCAQRPTQSSVLCRSIRFKAEVAEHPHIGRIASSDLNMLAQEGIYERIPRFSAQFVIKSPSTDPGRLNYSSREKSKNSSSISLISSLFQDMGGCARSAERGRCPNND